MCFSASASFGAGIILGGVGIASVKKAGSSLQRLFAAIPLLFAVQQITEAFVWLALMHKGDATLQSLPVYFFMFFAYVLWPIWVPLSILFMEADKKRKKVLQAFVIAGIVESLYTIVCMFLYPVHASVTNHHLIYRFNYPDILYVLNPVRDSIYFIATLPAAFISTHKKIRMFGVVLIASYLVSEIFFKGAVVSVWCYFAAALSVVVFFIIKKDFSKNLLCKSLSETH